MVPLSYFRSVFCILILSFTGLAYGGDTTDIEKKNENKLFAVPLVFFTPETNLSFGAAGIYTFRFKEELKTSRPSSVQLGGAYTLNKQILLYLPFQLFWQNEDYFSYGEVGYFKYFFFFYGVGNEGNEGVEERFDVSFPRLRLSLLKKVKPNIYLGFRYFFDYYDIKGVEPNGLLDQGDITGSQGGVISAPGLIGLYDSRDNIFWPSKGYFIEGVTQVNYKWTGSKFGYSRISLDAVKYTSTKWGQVLAINLFTDLTFGDPPFNEMARIGGTKKMRGYYEGRYRDNKVAMVQAEYRIPLFWRFGMTVFGGYAGVANQFNDFDLSYFKYNYGAGLRFELDRVKKLNVRIDYGVGEDTDGFYITFGEAF